MRFKSAIRQARTEKARRYAPTSRARIFTLDRLEAERNRAARATRIRTIRRAIRP